MKSISVIIPCYNAELTIDRCIESIVKQTVGIGDLEIILVNDASTDSTYMKLCAWEKLYPDSVIVIDCTENGKQGRARNIGMSYASGLYITFIDADDWISIFFAEEMLYLIKRYQSDIFCCSYDRVKRYNNIESIMKKGKNTDYNLKSISDRKRFLLLHWQATGIAGKLYSRNFLDKYHLLFPENIYYEDTYFSYISYMCANRITECKEVLYHYYTNVYGTVQGSNEGENRERLVSLRMFYDQCLKYNWLQEYYEEIELIFIRKYYVEMMEVMFRKFEKVDYTIYLGIRDWLIIYFPDFKKNQYLKEENSELDNFFLRCILEDFNEKQLESMRKLFLSAVYHIEKLHSFARKEDRKLAFPQKEDFFRSFQNVLLEKKEETFRESIQLFQCIPLKKAKEVQYDEIEKNVEVYRYIVEREFVISYIRECMKGRIQISQEEFVLYQRILQCLERNES